MFRAHFYQFAAVLARQVRFLPLLLFAPFLVLPEYFPPLIVAVLAVLLSIYVVGQAWLSGRLFLPFFLLLLPFPLLAGVGYWASVDKSVTLPKLYLLVTGLATVVLFGTSGAGRPEEEARDADERGSGSAAFGLRPAAEGPPSAKRVVVGSGLADWRPFFPVHVLWSWVFVMGSLSVGILGPFITEFRWGNKFLDLRGVGLALFPTGEILDVNVYGCLMAVAAPTALLLGIMHYRRGSGSLSAKTALFSLSIAPFALFAGLLLLSQSRAAWIGFAAGMALALVLLWRRGWLLVLIGLALLGVGIWAGGIDSSEELIDEAGAAVTMELRLELWDRSIDAIQDFPFTGIGPGVFRELIPLLYPLFLVAPDETPFHSHNLYLQVALDLGLGGLVALCALVAFAFFSPLKTPGGPGCLGVGYRAALTVFLVNGLLDSPLWMNKPMAVPFFLIGMLVANWARGMGGLSDGRAGGGGELYIQESGATQHTGVRAQRVEMVRTGPRVEEFDPALDTWALWPSNPLCSGWRFWLDRAALLVLWALISLLAISFAGIRPCLALAIAVVGAVYLGWEASRMMFNRPVPGSLK